MTLYKNIIYLNAPEPTGQAAESDLRVPKPTQKELQQSEQLLKDNLLTLLAESQDFALSEEEQKRAVFFAQTSEGNKVLGGAVLAKKVLLHPHKNQRFCFLFQGIPFWTCAFAFPPGIEDWQSMSQKQFRIVRTFYDALYDKLVEFGSQSDTPLIWVTLSKEEAYLLEGIRELPFLLKMFPYETKDGLFHGLLALREDYVKACFPLLPWRNAGYSLAPKRQEEPL